MQQFKNSLITCIALLVAGCASISEDVNVPVEDVSTKQPQYGDIELQESPAIRDTLPARRNENVAVLSLMKQTKRQQQSGDYAGAARTLERAIRIAPRDAELYYRLSEVRFTQRNFKQSEQLCRKAISLASGDPDLVSRSKALIVAAQQAVSAY